MDQESLACAADLPRIIHTAPYHFFYSQINIAVIQDDESVVSSKFQSGVSEISRRQFGSFDAYFCASGESN